MPSTYPQLDRDHDADGANGLELRFLDAMILRVSRRGDEYDANRPIEKVHRGVKCDSVERVVVAQFAHPVHENGSHAGGNVHLVVHPGLDVGVGLHPV